MKSYTAFHLFIIYIFEEDIFYNMIRGNEENALIIVVNTVLFIILFFMILVFTEMVELNFCNLSKNIKRNIAYRAESEDDKGIRRDTMIEIGDNYIVPEDYINDPSNKE